MADAKIVGGKLQYQGFIYVRSKPPAPGKPSSYWECTRLRKIKTCKARAITVGEGENLRVCKFDEHTHPSDLEFCMAEEVMHRMKRKLEDDPQAGPSSIMRDELRNVPEQVLAKLPERRNIKKAIRRVRRAELPPNPSRLADLGPLPGEYHDEVLDYLRTIAHHIVL